MIIKKIKNIKRRIEKIKQVLYDITQK